jgi:hypothetical protein
LILLQLWFVKWRAYALLNPLAKPADWPAATPRRKFHPRRPVAISIQSAQRIDRKTEHLAGLLVSKDGPIGQRAK